MTRRTVCQSTICVFLKTIGANFIQLERESNSFRDKITFLSLTKWLEHRNGTAWVFGSKPIRERPFNQFRHTLYMYYSVSKEASHNTEFSCEDYQIVNVLKVLLSFNWFPISDELLMNVCIVLYRKLW